MVRNLSKFAAMMIVALALGPFFALFPSSFLDQGADGRIHASFFTIALTLLDPFVWTCVANSLLVASLVSAISLGLGVPTARIIVKRGYGRSWGALLVAAAPVAVSPAAAGLGLLEGMRSIAPLSMKPWNDAWTWAAMIWALASNGVSLVAIITILSLRKVDPLWEDAARLAGATPRKIWRKIAWPAARPEVARALCLVFGFSLLDPSSPMVLGLRRTIGFQIVQAANEGALIGRAASLTLLGLFVTAVGRLLIGGWGGPRVERGNAQTGRASSPSRGSWTGLFRLIPAVAGIALLSLPPLAGLFLGLFGREDRGASGLPAIARELIEEPWIRDSLRNSVQLGILAVTVNLIAVRALGLGLSEREARERWIGLARAVEWLPPIVLGVGLMAVPVLSRMALQIGANQGGSQGPFMLFLKAALGWIDLRPGSWTPLVLATAALRFSIVARSRVETSREVLPACLDAVRLTGASRRRSPAAPWGGVSPAAILLTFSLAANALTLPLLLATDARTRPIGPTFLILAERPEPGGRLGCALAIVGVLLNLLGIIVAASELRKRPSEPL